MDRTEKVELTALCLIYKGNLLLLQNRIKEDWKGYTFPGGHVEKGESIVDSVIREMKEETGLTIRNPKLCGIKQFPIEGGRYLVFLFKTDEFEGELVSSDEGTVEWIDREELQQFQTVEDFFEMLPLFDDDKLTEFIYVEKSGKWEIEIR